MGLGWRGDKDWMHTVDPGDALKVHCLPAPCMSTMLSMSFACPVALQEPGVGTYYLLLLAIKAKLLCSHSWVSGLVCVGILLNL